MFYKNCNLYCYSEELEFKLGLSFTTIVISKVELKTTIYTFHRQRRVQLYTGM